MSSLRILMKLAERRNLMATEYKRMIQRNGSVSDLPSPTNGEIYIATDTKEMYFGAGGTMNKVGGSDVSVVDNKITNHLKEEKQHVVITKSVAQSIANDVNTQVLFDTINNRNGADYVELVEGRIRVKTIGLYRIIADIGFSANNSGIRQLQLVRGGAFVNVNATQGVQTGIIATSLSELTANSLVNVSVLQNSGVALDVTTNSRISIVKVADL